jgi:hypothetical protein
MTKLKFTGALTENKFASKENIITSGNPESL